jgi:hypothetical protein
MSNIDILTKAGTIVRRKSDGQVGTLSRIDVGEDSPSYAYVDMGRGRGEDDIWAGTLDAFEIPTPEQIYAAYRLADTQRAMAVDLLDTERSRTTALIKEKSDAEVKVEDLQRLNTNQMQRIEALTLDVNRAQAQVEVTKRAHAEDIATIGEKLLEEAESRSWCEEYDGVIDDINAKLHIELPRRIKDYDVTVYVRVAVSVTVSAYDEDGARSEAANDWRERLDFYSYPAKDAILEGTTEDSDDFDVEEIDR